jgi:hypothetical protein
MVDHDSVKGVMAPPRSEVPHDPVKNRQLRTAARQVSQKVVSQGVTAHGADAWHQAGFKGKGVKIGIIDTGFEGFMGLQDGADEMVAGRAQSV